MFQCTRDNQKGLAVLTGSADPPQLLPPAAGEPAQVAAAAVALGPVRFIRRPLPKI